MGRFPSAFAGQRIVARFPYNMPGEVVVAFGQSAVVVPDVIYTNQQELPIEIHRVIPRVAAVDDRQVPLAPQPDVDLLRSLVRLDVVDFGLDKKLMKAPTLLSDLIEGPLRPIWELDDPHTVPHSRGFQVVLSTLPAPSGLAATLLRVSLNFQGYTIKLGPAEGHGTAAT